MNRINKQKKEIISNREIRKRAREGEQQGGARDAAHGKGVCNIYNRYTAAARGMEKRNGGQPLSKTHIARRVRKRYGGQNCQKGAKDEKTWKKPLTKGKGRDNITKLSARQRAQLKNTANDGTKKFEKLEKSSWQRVWSVLNFVTAASSGVYLVN